MNRKVGRVTPGAPSVGKARAARRGLTRPACLRWEILSLFAARAEMPPDSGRLAFDGWPVGMGALCNASPWRKSHFSLKSS
jgi:hypothetical protein